MENIFTSGNEDGYKGLSVSASAIQIDTYEPHEAIAYVCNTLISNGDWALLSSDELPQALPADINWQDYLREHAADTLTLVTNFVEAVSHYPIALTHSLAYCIKHKKQLADYLTDFKYNLDLVMKERPRNNSVTPAKPNYLDQSLLGDNYGRTIYVTLKLSLDAIVAESKIEGELIAQGALAVLGLCSYLAPTVVPTALLREWLQQQPTPIGSEDAECVFDLLQAYSFLTHEEGWLSDASSGANRVTFLLAATPSGCRSVLYS